MDVAMEFCRSGFVLQNMIHWIKSVALPKEDMGRLYNAGIPEDGIAVGHCKSVNSRRFHNDCHDSSFTSSKPARCPSTGSQTVCRIWTKAMSNRWVGRKQDLRDRGNTWFIPYKTSHPPRTPPPCDLLDAAAGDVHPRSRY